MRQVLTLESWLKVDPLEARPALPRRRRAAP
jgi:hypothetical protein